MRREKVRVSLDAVRRELANEGLEAGTAVNIGSAVRKMLLIALFRVLLDASYSLCVVPYYSYLYPFRNAATFEQMALSWLLLALFAPLCIMTWRKNRPSDCLVAVLFLVSFVPTTSLVAFQGFEPDFVLSIVLFWFTFLVSNYLIGDFSINAPRAETRRLVVCAMLALLCIAVVYVSWRYTGFRINLDISSVYDLRLEAREYALPFPITYLIGAARVILPLLSVYLLWKRNYAAFLALVLVQVLLFSIDGSKSALFSLVLMVAAYAVIRKPSPAVIVKLLTAVVFVCLVVFLATGRTELLSYAVRRMMYLPALLHSEYFDFFSVNPPDYYIQSIFSKFGFESSYATGIPSVIAEVYHGSTSMSANNGLFSDAYANLGLPGCVLVPIIYIVLFRLLDACLRGLPRCFVIPALVPVALTFLSSSLFTALVSHGILLYGVILYFLPRPCESGKPKVGDVCWRDVIGSEPIDK